MRRRAFVRGERLIQSLHLRRRLLDTRRLLSGDAHARRPLHKMDAVFFFVLSVSCWNIRFGAVSNFRPTNSTSFRENLRNRVHLFRQL